MTLPIDLYGKLAEDNPDVRLSAAKELISGLRESLKEEEVVYALGRLFKGLASRRKSARIGFGVALTELLSVLTNVDIKNLLSLLEKHTTPSGNINGAEERDYYFGRIFGIEALLKSGVLSGESVTDEDFQSVINLLFGLAQSKSWLRESSAKMLCEIIIRYPPQAPTILTKIYETSLEKTSDGVAVILTSSALPSNPKLTFSFWGERSPLHLSSLALLSKVLCQSSSPDNENTTGIWKPRLHFVWDIIMDQYASNPVQCPFTDFWKVIVDEGLFSASSSPERKFWGFQLFERALQIIDPSQITAIFSRNFLRCLINQLGDPERYNYKAAKKTSTGIISAAEKKPYLAFPILKMLLGETTNFDSITKTKTIESILKNLDNPSVIKTVELFRVMTTECGELDDKAVVSRRQWVADQLLFLARGTNRDESSLQKLLLLFVEAAYFEFPANPKLDGSSRKIFQTRLLSALSHLGRTWQYNVILMIEKFGSEMNIELSDEISQIKNRVLRLLKKINKTKTTSLDEGTKEELDAFENILSFTLLQTYNGDVEAVQVLSELQGCYKEMFMKNPDDGFAAVQVLMDILLSFLSRNSAILRKLAERMFSAFSARLTDKSLSLLFDVLETKETRSGFQQIYSQEDEEMNISDDEEPDTTHNVSSDTALEYIVHSSEEDTELQDALVSALQDHALPDKDESEELLNDEEMFALDAQLVKIFKERKPENCKRQESGKAKENIIQFKHRVLDLLDLLVHCQSNRNIVFAIILPLLRLSRSTSSDQLGASALTVLRKLSKAKNLPSEVDLESSLLLIRQIHDEASKAKNPQICNVASSISLMIVKILVKHDKQNIEGVVKVYSDSINSWLLHRKSRIQGRLFFDFINWGKTWRESTS